MEPIYYIERQTVERKFEKIYGARFLAFLYGQGLLSRTFGRLLCYLIARLRFVSALYGWWQRLPYTKRKIQPFIDEFDVEASEFLLPVSAFRSFDDFFVRKLKPQARLIAPDNHSAIMPADARYRFYPRIDQVEHFLVKGNQVTLSSLLQNQQLANQYAKGIMVIARLAPPDYHRFHFPCECIPGPTQFIPGWLYSVNPIALRQRTDIFYCNKRTLCILDSKQFGQVLFLEIGATSVGSIHQTYKAGIIQSKGAEKGFFAFGASALIILFEEGKIRLDQDLLEAAATGLEIRCLMGQSLGTTA